MKPTALLFSSLCVLLTISCHRFVDATALSHKPTNDRSIPLTAQDNTIPVPLSSRAEVNSPSSIVQSPSPEFIGTPGEAFNSFIRRNAGRNVYLKLTFSEEPDGYRDSNADPFFQSTGNYTYFIDCVDDIDLSDTPWTSRCQNLKWDSTSKELSGYFEVSYPRGQIQGGGHDEPDAVIFDLVALRLNTTTRTVEPRPLSSYGGNRRYSDLPPGLTYLGDGGILDNSSSASPFPTRVIHVRRGTQEMLWYETILESDGKDIYEVGAVLILPSLSASEVLAYTCHQPGNSSAAIYAIALPTQTEQWTQIRAAWLLNQEQYYFEPISTQEVTCKNPNSGTHGKQR